MVPGSWVEQEVAGYEPAVFTVTPTREIPLSYSVGVFGSDSSSILMSHFSSIR